MNDAVKYEHNFVSIAVYEHLIHFFLSSIRLCYKSTDTPSAILGICLPLILAFVYFIGSSLALLLQFERMGI